MVFIEPMSSYHIHCWPWDAVFVPFSGICKFYLGHNYDVYVYMVLYIQTLHYDKRNKIIIITCIKLYNYVAPWYQVEVIDQACICGLVQDCSISNALAMEIMQSCTKPSIYSSKQFSLLCWFSDVVVFQINLSTNNKHICRCGCFCNKETSMVLYILLITGHHLIKIHSCDCLALFVIHRMYILSLLKKKV